MTDGFHDIAPGKLAMVVTHLEMREPAPLRNTALPDGVTFGAGPRDVAQYRDLIRRVGAQWLWFSRLEIPEPELAAILNDPNVELHTLIQDGEARAILELDFREKGACELAFFGLASELIGTGAGAFLMDRAIELAWARDITRFHVHTCTLDSPQALGFYVRSGFTPYRRQIEIADDPRMTGILPKDVAAHVPLI